MYTTNVTVKCIPREGQSTSAIYRDSQIVRIMAVIQRKTKKISLISVQLKCFFNPVICILELSVIGVCLRAMYAT